MSPNPSFPLFLLLAAQPPPPHARGPARRCARGLAWRAACPPLSLGPAGWLARSPVRHGTAQPLPPATAWWWAPPVSPHPMPLFIFPITPTHVPLSSPLGSPLSLFPKSPSPPGTAPASTLSVHAALSSTVSLPVSFFPDLPPPRARGLRGRDPPDSALPSRAECPQPPGMARLLPPRPARPCPGLMCARPWRGAAIAWWRVLPSCPLLGVAVARPGSLRGTRRGPVRSAWSGPCPAWPWRGAPPPPLVPPGPARSRRGPTLLATAWPRYSSQRPGAPARPGPGVVRMLPGTAPSCVQHLGATRRAPGAACAQHARAPARLA
jgi:hypothetical protein